MTQASTVTAARVASGFDNKPTIEAARLHGIFLAARRLAERANIAASIPRYADLKEITSGHDEQVQEAISELMEAING